MLMLKAYESNLTAIAARTPETASLAKLIAGVGLTCGASYCILKTIQLYFNRRKYKHIPGPDTKGCVDF
jgi:hypothetical protein